MDKTISFYCDVLGMKSENFTPSGGGETRRSLKFGNQKINLHCVGSPYKPHVKKPRVRSSWYLLFEFHSNRRVARNILRKQYRDWRWPRSEDGSNRSYHVSLCERPWSKFDRDFQQKLIQAYSPAKLLHRRRIELTRGRCLGLTRTLKPILTHFIHHVSVKLVSRVKPS